MHDLNLIPHKYFKGRARPKVAALIVFILFLLGSVSLYFVIEPMFEIKRLEAKSSLYDQHLVEINEIEKRINKLTEEEGILIKRLAALNEIDGSKLLPTVVLSEIKKVLPNDVMLTGMSYSRESVGLTALSKTAVGVSEYYVELMKSDKFSKVTLSPVSKSTEGYSFSIQLALMSGSGDNDEQAQNN